MKHKIIIIEDEVIIAENLRRIIAKLGYDVIAVVNSYGEGMRVIRSHQPDLYLIDINLNEGKDNGIRLAKLINDTSNIPIIYITSNADSKTVNDAKFTKPIGYILKPFNKKTIYSTLEIALYNRSNHIDGINVRHKGDLIKILFKDILYIKASSVYVDIHTTQGIIIHRDTFVELMKVLSSNFIQVHRSYIVNINHIESFNSSQVTLTTAKIPIGRLFKSQFQQAITDR